MRRMRWLLLALGVALAGCGTKTPPPACITVDTTCAPGYQPTFDNVWQNTLLPTCAQSASCHSATGHMGNLDMSDEATAYMDLLAPAKLDPKRMRVVPGDPACSLMTVRTDSPGADYQMPPGMALDEPTRCALVQWVKCGAPGPGEPCP